MKKQYRIVYREHTNEYRVEYRYCQGWFNILKLDWLSDYNYYFTELEPAKLRMKELIDTDNKQKEMSTWKVVK